LLQQTFEESEALIVSFIFCKDLNRSIWREDLKIEEFPRSSVLSLVVRCHFICDFQPDLEATCT
jgi:hypothetical protein